MRRLPTPITDSQVILAREPIDMVDRLQRAVRDGSTSLLT
jgi:hypothetical protein